MQGAAGTISFVLKSLRALGQPWPSALFVNADQMVSKTEGHALLNPPIGILGLTRRYIPIPIGGCRLRAIPFS
jgi:hypothetical protein